MVAATNETAAQPPAEPAWTPRWLVAAGAARERLLDEARRATQEAITFATEFRTLLKVTPKRAREMENRWRRFFSILFPLDGPGLPSRTVTLPELLAPGCGTLIVMEVAKTLELLDLGDVAIDLLQDLRVLLRFIERSHRLPSGFDLVDHYGRLASPIGDGDLRKRRSRKTYPVPTFTHLREIFDRSLDWAEHERRQKLTATRNAIILIFLFCTGLRGTELRQLDLLRQAITRTSSPQLYEPVIWVPEAKGTPERETEIWPPGELVTNHWLAELRPQIAEPHLGSLFPCVPTKTCPERGRPMAASTLTGNITPLLEHLKKLGLLDPRFTLHGTRKTFARHFLRLHNNDVAALLQVCGWENSSMLTHYLVPTAAELSAELRAFARLVGERT